MRQHAPRQHAVEQNALAFVVAVRGTPIIIQIFAIFTVLPSLGIRLPPFESAIITLVLNAGGYLTENIRSAFRSIPKGLIEVADALGMSPFMKLRRVVIPQSLKVMIPVFANMRMVVDLKVPDMMRRHRRSPEEDGDIARQREPDAGNLPGRSTAPAHAKD